MAEVIRMGREADFAAELRRQWGERIKRRREFKGLTQQAMADGLKAIGHEVTAQAVSEWERGKAAPRWHLQFAIAQVLDVEHSSLFHGAVA